MRLEPRRRKLIELSCAAHVMAITTTYASSKMRLARGIPGLLRRANRVRREQGRRSKHAALIDPRLAHRAFIWQVLRFVGEKEVRPGTDGYHANLRTAQRSP